MIYFQLKNKTNSNLSVYIQGGVQYLLNQLYIGQVLLSLDTISVFPNQSIPSASVVAYSENSTTLSLNSYTYETVEILMKIPPSSLYGYLLYSSYN